jgi:hypothetical protein
MKLTELRFGFGNDLRTYKTKGFESECFDIEVRLPNGEVVELNARATGYALRLTRNPARVKAGLTPRETLREINY